ncbi:MAG: hypothetical protein COZ21_09450 [Bacteroidetes bacterium CG_4_10_14_3_um_filter_31_20]|nr:hypothetical protein [Bacteroidota bacterium]NCP79758.1 hypothetical protein [archaeon]PIY03348.1 MAG: hypothetical protein COZ21_09450 [Bacteroidetes bacterium CG_4_10_14_3_um_filter_31_20]
MNEKEFFIYLGNRNSDRIRFHFKKEKGKILVLLVQYESIINEKWVAIVRYDCAHGFFHRDILHPKGDKEKKVIDVPDLKYGFKFAKQDMEDRWEWYKEQYLIKMTNDK